MSLREIAGHARKKAFQWADAGRERDWAAVLLEPVRSFPELPDPARAPEELRAALRRDTDAILSGCWKFFGHLELKVDDPPRWHCDYLAGRDLATRLSAFKLNHRALPDGADIKLIWELSRWSPLVRLAQATHVLGDDRAARKCVAWLADWVTHNPPYRGWNWTSALEAGLRLIQFTWMDALLRTAAGSESVPSPAHPPRTPEPPDRLNGNGRAPDPGESAPTWLEELETLRYEILPAHAWFVWRHKSFGSSANNHLLGELAGLIVATARWPALAQWGAPLETLQALWEREVLAQFAPDGGNREQALNYHLFSFEFCWQARQALRAAGRRVSSGVEERLGRAARFFCEVQVRPEPWDYGDSDNAFVTPLFLSERSAIREWCAWLERATGDRALAYWLGEPPAQSPPLGHGACTHAVPRGDWRVFSDTGLAILELGAWFLRWDLSPLGYLKTAAHGHLDALHLSAWFRGVAMIIDPGTGCYYHDSALRAWLASRAAHNGPCPPGEEFPRRLGPFLWAAHHARPTILAAKGDADPQAGLAAELALPTGVLRRRIRRVSERDGWEIVDEYQTLSAGPDAFTVRWQFAPGAFLKRLGPRHFALKRADVTLEVEVGGDWEQVALIEERSQNLARSVPLAEKYGGVVSPAFRRLEWAPFLELRARPGDKPCVFRTAFLASHGT